MFFRCEDLENYVREVDPEKIYVLLINKCDLISKEVRYDALNFVFVTLTSNE